MIYEPSLFLSALSRALNKHMQHATLYRAHHGPLREFVVCRKQVTLYPPHGHESTILDFVAYISDVQLIQWQTTPHGGLLAYKLNPEFTLVDLSDFLEQMGFRQVARKWWTPKYWLEGPIHYFVP